MSTLPQIPLRRRAETNPPDEATLVSLEHRVAALELGQTRTSSFQRWLLGVLIAIGMAISGAAYQAHSTLADRLIEVSTATTTQLARVEERLRALQDRWDAAGRRDRPAGW